MLENGSAIITNATGSQTALTNLVLRQTLQPGKESALLAESVCFLGSRRIALVGEAVVEVSAEQIEGFLRTPGNHVSDGVAEPLVVNPDTEILRSDFRRVSAVDEDCQLGHKTRPINEEWPEKKNECKRTLTLVSNYRICLTCPVSGWNRGTPGSICEVFNILPSGMSSAASGGCGDRCTGRVRSAPLPNPAVRHPHRRSSRRSSRRTSSMSSSPSSSAPRPTPSSRSSSSPACAPASGRRPRPGRR